LLARFDGNGLRAPITGVVALGYNRMTMLGRRVLHWLKETEAN
jgi:hypothetical protein